MTKAEALTIKRLGDRNGHDISILLDTSGRRATWIASIDRRAWVADYNSAREQIN